MVDDRLAALIADQSGTIARQQLVALGAGDPAIRRLVRRRELVRVHRGVYVNHTGTPTWIQRARCAVLATSRFDPDGAPHGSALARDSALRFFDGPGSRMTQAMVHVLIDDSRYIAKPQGVTVERCRSFSERVSPRPGLPCVRYEEALIDVAQGCDKWASFALVASAVGARQTSVRRLASAAERRQTMRRRRWFNEVLTDIGCGTCSVLERGFVTEVLRPHGLPRPRRQSRAVTAIGVAYRDAVFGSVVVELDGRAFHATPDRRDADLDRDLVAAADGLATVRLGWGQVYRRPCRTAVFLARVLQANVKPCGPGCTIAQTEQAFGQ